MALAKFSPSTGGIYPLAVFKTFPSDAVDIPDVMYQRFQNGTISGFDVSGGVVVDAATIPKTISEIRTSMQCQAWQLKRALTQMGLRSAVETAVAAADQDTKDMWEYSTSYQRTHPIVLALATALGKTDAEIDDLFTLALSITQ